MGAVVDPAVGVAAEAGTIVAVGRIGSLSAETPKDRLGSDCAAQPAIMIVAVAKTISRRWAFIVAK